MSKELKYKIGDKVKLEREGGAVIREIVKIDKYDTELPYLVMWVDSKHNRTSTDWAAESELTRVPFKIADLFRVYQTIDYQDRKFITPHGHTIYFEDKEIRVSNDDWFIYEEITDIYTSYDMMDIDVIEIKEKHKEMTVEEIEGELGYRIKIVGD